MRIETKPDTCLEERQMHLKEISRVYNTDDKLNIYKKRIANLSTASETL